MTGAVRLSLRCHAFSLPNLWREVRAASRLPDESEPDQVKYLFSYLSAPGARARSFIVESPYVDRHYLEEYTGYYASALRAPPPRATRIHALSCELDDAGLNAWLEEAKGDYEAVRTRIQEAYLGFVVVRPLPSAPIGRTVLRPYGDRPSRFFAVASMPHRVHLAGFELEVEGVPFQQQDQAVGACATTALWSALSRVTRADGGRAATPLAVTAAATKYLLHGRVLPASAGLDLNQIIGAIRELGYSPHALSCKDGRDHGEFELALKCYLRSGIPVILRIRHVGADEAHAITVVGFRESDEEEPVDDITLKLGEGHALRSTGLSRLYVHDDRLGPYARSKWVPVEKDERPALQLMPGQPGFEKFAVKANVWGAIAPLYPKLRLTAEDLIGYAGEVLPLMSQLAGQEQRDRLKVDPRFMLGGQYLREVYGLDIAPSRARAFAMTALLSRYVGVIRFSLDDRWFADVLCDTTDIRRDVPLSAPVLGMLPRDEGSIEACRTLLDVLTGGGRGPEERPVLA